MAAAKSSTCAVCGKSIQKGASIKRHERYCRSRHTHPRPPRRKSCFACIQAKTRCDASRPRCGNCQRKQRECLYSSGSLLSTEDPFATPPSRSSREQQSQTTPKQVPVASWRTPQTSLAPGILTTYEVSSLYVRPESLTILPSRQGDFTSAKNISATSVVSRKPDLLPITSMAQSHLLKPKELKSGRMELVHKLVSQVVCSYPERRMNEVSCPPFIHPSTFIRWKIHVKSNDPMVICHDIARRFAARQAHSYSSIWDAIASEQERLYDHRVSFDKWQYLSSAQALTMYLLMLAAENESILVQRPELPIALLFTLGAIFAQLHQILPGFVARGGKPIWEDWIFTESKLRTATTYFILTLLFNLEFGLPCDRESDYKFEDLEVPAVKMLWEAKNELSWNEEFDLTASHRSTVLAADSRLKYRDLERLDRWDCGSQYPGVEKGESGLAERVEKWHKEMDELGMLVALCSTMV